MSSLEEMVSELEGQELLTEEQQRAFKKARHFKESPYDTKIAFSQYEREWLNDKDLDFALEYHKLRDLNFTTDEILICWIKNIKTYPIFRHCIAQLCKNNNIDPRTMHIYFIKYEFPIYELKEFDAIFPISIPNIGALSLYCKNANNDMIEFYIQKYIKDTNQETESPHVVLSIILYNMEIPLYDAHPSYLLFCYLIRKLLSFAGGGEGGNVAIEAKFPPLTKEEIVRTIIGNWRSKGVCHKYPFHLLMSIVCYAPYNVCPKAEFHQRFMSAFKARGKFVDYYETN